MPSKNVAIQTPILQILANQHTAGDGDFDGHGPMMYLNAALQVLNEYQIGLYCHVRFEETESDWTTWQGSFNGVVYDIRTQGAPGKIVSVVTPPFSSAEQLNGYGTHHRDFGMGGLVQSYDAVGDSNGGWGGGDDTPQVTITFNNVVLELEEPPPLGALHKWVRSNVPLLIFPHR